MLKKTFLILLALSTCAPLCAMEPQKPVSQNFKDCVPLFTRTINSVLALKKHNTEIEQSFQNISIQAKSNTVAFLAHMGPILVAIARMSPQERAQCGPDLATILTHFSPTMVLLAELFNTIGQNQELCAEIEQFIEDPSVNQWFKSIEWLEAQAILRGDRTVEIPALVYKNVVICPAQTVTFSR